MAYLFIVGLIVLFFAHYLSSIVNPLLVSLLIAYMLHPIISWFDKWNVNRTVSIMAIYGIFFAGFLAFVVFGIPEIYVQGKQFAFEFIGEQSTDTNKNGHWDSGDSFEDINKNNKRDPKEPFQDLNQNGLYDSPEIFTDLNGDSECQPEELFLDKNGNREWDKGYLTLILAKSKNWMTQLSQKVMTHQITQKQVKLEQIQTDLADAELALSEKEKKELQKEMAQLQSELHQLKIQTENEEQYYQQLLMKLQSQLAANREKIAAQSLHLLQFSIESIFAGIESILIFITYLILMPIYVFFFARGMDTMWKRFVTYLPGYHRAYIVKLLEEIHFSVSSFFHGRIIIFIVVSLITILGLFMIGVKFALLLGLITGLGIMIPFLSLIIGFLPALGILYFTEGSSNGQIIALCALFAFAMGLTQFVLEPIILGKKVNIHPVTILVSFFIGGKLFGFFGVLCAVPMASIVKILFIHLVLPSLKEIASEDKTNEFEKEREMAYGSIISTDISADVLENEVSVVPEKETIKTKNKKNKKK